MYMTQAMDSVFALCPLPFDIRFRSGLFGFFFSPNSSRIMPVTYEDGSLLGNELHIVRNVEVTVPSSGGMLILQGSILWRERARHYFCEIKAFHQAA